MSGRVKLIWDFYGPTAERTAQHHRTHLDEFARLQQLRVQTTGAEQFAEGHWIAWLLAEPQDVESLRASLSPNRGLPA